MRFTRSAPLWLTALLLAAFGLGAWQLLARAPAGERVALIRIRLPPGDRPLILGHAELGQRPGARSAAADHLQLRHDRDGWWIANLSAQRRVDAPTATHHTRYLRRWPLAKGGRIRLDGTTLEVVEASPNRLVLSGPAGTARWEGDRLTQAQPPFDACPPEGDPWWRRHLDGSAELRLFSLGGQVPCARRWGLPGVPALGAWVLWRDGTFWLAPGRAEVRFAAAGSDTWQGFAERAWRLDDPADPTRRLILGRTHYLPTWAGDRLTLTPLDGADLWPPDQTQPRPAPRDERVELDWASAAVPGLGDWVRRHWVWPLAALGLGLIGAVVLAARPVRFGAVPRGLRLAALLPALVCGTLTLATAWAGPVPLGWLLWSLGLGWGASGLLLALRGWLHGPAGWLWVAATGLVYAGALVQGQLGLGGDTGRWLALAEGHCRVLALVGWLILPLTLVSPGTWKRLMVDLTDPGAPPGWRALRRVLVLLVVGLLLAQLAFGREEGLGGFQPTEGVKTLIALFLAYAGQRLWARRAGRSQNWRDHIWRSSLALTGPALALLLFAAMLLWAVRDLSPALLLLLLALPVLWRLARHPSGKNSHRTWWLRAGLAAVILTGVGLLAWVRAAPDSLPRWTPQYARLMAWAAPARFPETGHQVNAALARAAAGGGLGPVGGPFGWNGEVMDLPVVQNDFIGAFVLNRFGAAGGSAVLVLQLLFVGALLALADAAADWGRDGNALREQQAGGFLSLALFALASLFLAHGIIAWGNVLGLLPVMGQPMTWIAAGNSHLLLFALPALLLGLATGWITQDPRVD